MMTADKPTLLSNVISRTASTTPVTPRGNLTPKVMRSHSRAIFHMKALAKIIQESERKE